MADRAQSTTTGNVSAITRSNAPEDDTGFHEPLNPERNTTKMHPEAKSQPHESLAGGDLINDNERMESTVHKLKGKVMHAMPGKHH